MAKAYKQHKRGKTPFVMLDEWIMDTPAWATLSVGARSLYLEIKRRYNGKNNGEIFFSHRDAATVLDVHRNTVGPWFKALQERGFIVMTQAPHLGPSGVGRSSTWALTEVKTVSGHKPTFAFKKWKPDHG